MGLRIPQNQVVQSKYTAGKEYIIESTYREYQGYYYEFNGKYYEGNTFNFNINGSNGLIIAGGTDTLTVLGQVTDFDLRNSTNILTNDVRTVYGNFYTSSTGGTINAGTNTTTLAGYSGSFTINTANRVLDFPISIDGNGNYTLSNSYICC